jgi:hypothetical protein
MSRPFAHFYLAVALISVAMAVLSFYKEYLEAGLIHALNAMWTFIGYRWHSLCYKQKQLIRKLKDKITWERK